MLLDRKAILAAPDNKPTRVDVPEWGGHVFVRAMSVAEAGSLGQDKGADMASRLAVRCICDESGARLLSDGDVAPLGEKSAAAMNRVLQVINEVNGFAEKAVQPGEASAGITGAGSSSDSPAISAG